MIKWSCIVNKHTSEYNILKFSLLKGWFYSLTKNCTSFEYEGLAKSYSIRQYVAVNKEGINLSPLLWSFLLGAIMTADSQTKLWLAWNKKGERRGRCSGNYEDKCFSRILQVLPQLLGCVHIYHKRNLGRYRQTNKLMFYRNVTFWFITFQLREWEPSFRVDVLCSAGFSHVHSHRVGDKSG